MTAETTRPDPAAAGTAAGASGGAAAGADSGAHRGGHGGVPAPVPALTHLDADGRARMVDVAAKPVTDRVAVAACEVRLAPSTAALLLDGQLPKGDALPVVRLAGIQAAKRTHELIPLCHQVALTSVDVDVEVDRATGRVAIRATARATDRTGVEMEAMTAVSVAALTLYDLVKAVQRDVVISEVRLREKRGGRSGDVVLP